MCGSWKLCWYKSIKSHFYFWISSFLELPTMTTVFIWDSFSRFCSTLQASASQLWLEHLGCTYHRLETYTRQIFQCKTLLFSLSHQYIRHMMLRHSLSSLPAETKSKRFFICLDLSLYDWLSDLNAIKKSESAFASGVGFSLFSSILVSCFFTGLQYRVNSFLEGEVMLFLWCSALLCQVIQVSNRSRLSPDSYRMSLSECIEEWTAFWCVGIGSHYHIGITDAFYCVREYRHSAILVRVEVCMKRLEPWMSSMTKSAL